MATPDTALKTFVDARSEIFIREEAADGSVTFRRVPTPTVDAVVRLAMVEVGRLRAAREQATLEAARLFAVLERFALSDRGRIEVYQFDGEVRLKVVEGEETTIGRGRTLADAVEHCKSEGGPL